MSEEPLACVLRYHQQTKHHLDRHARSLGFLDWATQPDPFRRYDGAPLVSLEQPPLLAEPRYDALFSACGVPPEPLSRTAVSRLFYDSLALSAWKQAGGGPPWSLRINPSSGDLHPTEGYLIAGPLAGLSDQPAIWHYAPYFHALERRLTLSGDRWQDLAAALPADAVLVALSSIYWRESWKYGERAFRYCQHDVGHAIGAICFAAATLGWQTRLIESVSDDALAALLGINRQHGVEAEHPDCLLAVFPGPRGAGGPAPALQLAAPLLEHLARAEFAGEPNRLSADHHPWPILDEISRAVHYVGQSASDPAAAIPAAGGPSFAPGAGRVESPLAEAPQRDWPAQQIIRRRRSAVEMDGRTAIARETFYQLLRRLTPGGGFPFDALPWPPSVALVLFVHRVEDLAGGLYLLVRHPEQEHRLRDALLPEFTWRRPPDCPADLNFWCLAETDCRRAVRVISCQQAIASDGAFSLGMLAEFEPVLRHRGPWFYPRLFWETGLIGQLLYLEAEAAGLRGTGIGCFYDDALHELLGLRGRVWQSLYHFTVGGAIDDPRLKTIPPYAHLNAALGG
jgi:SagB-type dehydrogenase family enzyme